MLIVDSFRKALRLKEAEHRKPLLLEKGLEISLEHVHFLTRGEFHFIDFEVPPIITSACL